MNIMRPPLHPLQRDTAQAALLLAAKQKKEIGIRPAEDIPKKISAGTRVAELGDADSAIERARSAWPKERRFSAFGADSFRDPNPGDEGAAWLTADADGNNPICGDGCFDNCEDFGVFEVPPSLDLTVPEEAPGA